MRNEHICQHQRRVCGEFFFALRWINVERSAAGQRYAWDDRCGLAQPASAVSLCQGNSGATVCKPPCTRLTGSRRFYAQKVIQPRNFAADAASWQAWSVCNTPFQQLHPIFLILKAFISFTFYTLNLLYSVFRLSQWPNASFYDYIPRPLFTSLWICFFFTSSHLICLVHNCVIFSASWTELI